MERWYFFRIRFLDCKRIVYLECSRIDFFLVKLKPNYFFSRGGFFPPGLKPIEMAMKPETFEKYKLVVDEWLVNGWNGTQAYLKYYSGATDETAATEFRRILRIPEISDYASKRREETKKKLDTTHKGLLEELKNWAYADVSNFIDLPLEDVKSLPEDLRRLITGFERKTRTLVDGTEITTVKLTFVSKEKAIEMIEKHTGFFAEHNFQKNVELSSAERQEVLRKIEERRAKLDQRKIDELM